MFRIIKNSADIITEKMKNRIDFNLSIVNDNFFNNKKPAGKKNKYKYLSSPFNLGLKIVKFMTINTKRTRVKISSLINFNRFLGLSLI